MESNTEKIRTSNDRIRELLDIHEISQTEFCKKTGLTKSAVSNYLHGERLPRQDQLSKICDAFDVNPAWLMGYDVPMERLRADHIKPMYGAHIKFTDDGKSTVDWYVDFYNTLCIAYHDAPDSIKQAVNKLLDLEDEAERWGDSIL